MIQQLVRHMQERPEGAEILVILQSLAQLDDCYGEDIRRVIIDNCAYKLVLSVTDDKAQKALSDLAGHRAVKVKSTLRWRLGKCVCRGAWCKCSRADSAPHPA